MTIILMKKTTVLRVGYLLLTLLLVSAAIEDLTVAEAFAQSSFLPIPVFVSIGAHLDFCQQIGGRRVAVKLALPPGKSPETYSPTPQQINNLSRARLYFKVGLPFESAFLKKLRTLPRSPEIVDTQTGIKLQPMPGELYDQTHNRHPQRHEGLDPHTWLDPELARHQAKTIYQTLCRIDPKGKNIYTSNYSLLELKLNVLDDELKKSFAPFHGRTIFVYHPAFNYFARAFGLKQRAIEMGGKTPKARELTAFIKRARAENIAALFVQPQFDRQSAEKIAGALNCAVVAIDPLAVNYCANLKHIATTIQAHIKVEK